jgi:hypothetical protein
VQGFYHPPNFQQAQGFYHPPNFQQAQGFYHPPNIHWPQGFSYPLDFYWTPTFLYIYFSTCIFDYFSAFLLSMRQYFRIGATISGL